ncbi:hypothetical protein NC653_022295 [Populus alba x Populus x berolinensis]|uniref:EamA domain-containing protein n=1 Tax=Populus alba x Populus x berolinensis TaxID=444605 RepID=A0AAD6MFT9_9ROSI|nr:hypothetical protein NC653_022285 [Populus alba x Populus x berolinensis]KAJ6984030.1 hypothetical protein NC653_022295 [Populus alba x Populus x berolinensis]
MKILAGAFSLSLKDLIASDILALLYTSIFGSAISYGVYFYSATKGCLTKLNSLTFLTPMFASIFGQTVLVALVGFQIEVRTNCPHVD